MINAIAEASGVYGMGQPQTESAAPNTSVPLSVQDMQTLHWAFVSKKGKFRIAAAIEHEAGPIDETDAWMIYCQQMALRGVAVWNLR